VDQTDNDSESDAHGDGDEANPAGRRRPSSREAGRSPRCRKRSAAGRYSSAAVKGGPADWRAGRHGSTTARGAGAGSGPGKKRQRRRRGSETAELGSDDQSLAAEQL